eukprot:TRINITY_DN4944_c0_g4_i1.p1 TRINITY_DN4944_c0_g4~~TRINITY_DN4944_c0_g4_i1.p1  ORF type:complete len:172 (-),score=1.62 TRINITY_DN4944_c0_g4_i1:100-615(-)
MVAMNFYTSVSSFADVMQQSPELQNLILMTKNLELLNKAVLKFYGTEYNSHLKVAKLDNGLLVIATKDQAWNHKIRFKVCELLSYLRKNSRWLAIRDVKCVVKLELLENFTPDYKHFSQEKSAEIANRYQNFPKPTPPSKAAARNIEQTSSYIQHPQLAETLQRFARLFIN